MSKKNNINRERKWNTYIVNEVKKNKLQYVNVCNPNSKNPNLSESRTFVSSDFRATLCVWKPNSGFRFQTFHKCLKSEPKILDFRHILKKVSEKFQISENLNCMNSKLPSVPISAYVVWISAVWISDIYCTTLWLVEILALGLDKFVSGFYCSTVL